MNNNIYIYIYIYLYDLREMADNKHKRETDVVDYCAALYLIDINNSSIYE